LNTNGSKTNGGIEGNSSTHGLEIWKDGSGTLATTTNQASIQSARNINNKNNNINNNKKKLKVDNVDGNQSEKSCIDSDVADEIEYKFDPNYEDGLRNRFFSPQKLG